LLLGNRPDELERATSRASFVILAATPSKSNSYQLANDVKLLQLLHVGYDLVNCSQLGTLGQIAEGDV
jgi:hypothetical protein